MVAVSILQYVVSPIGNQVYTYLSLKTDPNCIFSVPTRITEILEVYTKESEIKVMQKLHLF